MSKIPKACRNWETTKPLGCVVAAVYLGLFGLQTRTTANMKTQRGDHLARTVLDGNSRAGGNF